MAAPAAASVALGSEQAPFGVVLLELAARRPDVVVLSADLSKYTDILPFAEAHPDRFFQMGMAEQNLMGTAGGLAKAGLLPIAVTYGVFATRRAFEQVAMALATGPTRVIIVAFLPGLTTPFRATHQATEDLALMRTIPGMTVVDPADSTELKSAFLAAVEADGPVYLRGLRGTVSTLFDPAAGIEVGRARVIRGGSEVGIITSGIAAEWVLEAQRAPALDELDAAHLHVPMLKPFDGEAVLRFCERLERVVTVENHSIVGGLGSAVAEVLAESGSSTRLTRLGVPDVWAPAGSLQFVRKRLALDEDGLAAAIANAPRAQR
jgi:transketolase